MSDLILECKNVSRSFASPSGKVEVLKGVDLAIRAGEIVSIRGSSGVGKSTLLNVIGLLDQPTSGSVLYFRENKPVLDSATIRNRQRALLRNEFLGFVFQFYHLLADMSVLENVMLPTMMRRSWLSFAFAKRQIRERAQSLLEQVGVSHRAKHRPNTLSGGERQRVAIARALMNQPRLLLCDEPTGNLDTETSERIHDLFLELNETLGTTFLIVTHDNHLASQTQRSVEMIDGRFDTADIGPDLEPGAAPVSVP